MSTIGLCGVQMNDESHLPMTEQSLLFRLRMRAHINDYMTAVSADEPPAKPTMYEISQLSRKKWR